MNEEKRDSKRAAAEPSEAEKRNGLPKKPTGKQVFGRWVLDQALDAKGRNPLAEEESIQSNDMNAD